MEYRLNAIIDPVSLIPTLSVPRSFRSNVPPVSAPTDVTTNTPRTATGTRTSNKSKGEELRTTIAQRENVIVRIPYVTHHSHDLLPLPIVRS